MHFMTLAKKKNLLLTGIPVYTHSGTAPRSVTLWWEIKLALKSASTLKAGRGLYNCWESSYSIWQIRVVAAMDDFNLHFWCCSMRPDTLTMGWSLHCIWNRYPNQRDVVSLCPNCMFLSRITHPKYSNLDADSITLESVWWCVHFVLSENHFWMVVFVDLMENKLCYQ